MRSYLFVNRFYWPDEPATAQLLGDLAQGLASRGHRVSVLASAPANGRAATQEVRNGVHIYRVPSSRLGRFHVLLRIVDFALFQLLVQVRLLGLLHRDDTLVVFSDPPMIGAALWPIAVLKSARLVHYAQDIYPEVAMRLSPHPVASSLLGFLRPIRDFVWRHSRGCVVLGLDMAALAHSRNIPETSIGVLPNWAPSGLAEEPAGKTRTFRETWGLGDSLVVMYSGNIGRVHDLSPVLHMADLLKDDPALVFVFVGGGASRRPLELEAARLKLPNVRFLPPQPRETFAVSLSAADIHVVTLKEGCETTVYPSKLYGAAAVGRPILFMGPPSSEIARTVVDRRMGLSFGRDQVGEAAAALRHLATHPEERRSFAAGARSFHESEQGLRRALEFWETWPYRFEGNRARK